MTYRGSTTADGASSASVADDSRPALRSRPLDVLGTRRIYSNARYAGVTGINGYEVEGEDEHARIRWVDSRPSRGRRVRPHYSLDDYDNFGGWVELAAARGNVKLDEIDGYNKRAKIRRKHR